MKKQLLWACSSFLLFLVACNSPQPADEAASTTTDSTAVAPAEFADMKYADIVRKGMDNMSKGDITAWMESYADNAVYQWNNGDSLAGKAAISEYWTKRRSEVIDSISFSNQVFLPVKVNTPQANEPAGIWVLAWYQTDAKYKTGKSMTQWIHSLSHFDANGKIDLAIQYLDRAPINAAMTK